MKRTLIASAVALSLSMLAADAAAARFGRGGLRKTVACGVTVGVKGRFKLEAVKPDGTRRVLADWFDNLILDAGLNRMGTGAYFSSCQVGTGNTAPAVTDTGLAAFTAGTSTIQSSSSGTNGTAPYYGFQQRTFRFAQGAAAGNLAEVGVGWSTSGSTLFSRALIKDAGGTPTTITVQADEFLDISYELRLYAPTGDTAAVVTISGTEYTFTIRAAAVTSSAWVPENVAVNTNSNGTGEAIAYNGALAAVTATGPSGLSDSTTTTTAQAYSNNSLQRDFQAYWNLDAGNLAGGLTAFKLPTTIGAFQFGVTPAMAKTSVKLLTLLFRVSWARHV